MGITLPTFHFGVDIGTDEEESIPKIPKSLENGHNEHGTRMSLSLITNNPLNNQLSWRSLFGR